MLGVAAVSTGRDPRRRRWSARGAEPSLRRTAPRPETTSRPTSDHGRCRGNGVTEAGQNPRRCRHRCWLGNRAIKGSDEDFPHGREGSATFCEQKSRTLLTLARAGFAARGRASSKSFGAAFFKKRLLSFLSNAQKCATIPASAPPQSITGCRTSNETCRTIPFCVEKPLRHLLVAFLLPFGDSSAIMAVIVFPSNFTIPLGDRFARCDKF